MTDRLTECSDHLFPVIVEVGNLPLSCDVNELVLTYTLQIFILGSVFARMSPDQKSKLVEDLQDLKLVTSPCIRLCLLTAGLSCF